MSKFCQECKVEYPDTQKFCPECGSKLADKPSENPLGGLIDVSGDGAAVRADVNIGSIDNSRTIVERQKSEKELELEALNQFRSKAQEFMNLSGRIDSDAKRQLNVLAKQLGLSMEQFKTVIQEVMSGAGAGTGLGVANGRYLAHAQQAIRDNNLNEFVGLLPRLEAMASMAEDDNAQYLYHLAIAVTSPATSIRLYEQQTDENYWRTFWAIISYARSGRHSEADALLARMNPQRFDKPKDDQNLLEALSNFIKGDKVNAEQFLCEIFDPSTQVMALWRAVESMIYEEELNELDARFYLEHILVTPEQLYAMAREADGEKRISLLTTAAEAGSIEAICELAECYSDGNGVNEDLELAAKLWKQGADAGSSEATGRLGVCYVLGQGVDKNQEKGVELLERAVKEGNARAMNELGSCYCYGVCVEQDDERAVELWKASAKMGYTPAMNDLAAYYYWFSCSDCSNDGIAFDWWEKSAKAGDVEAMNKVADCYYWGNCVELDRAMSMAWWRKAVEKKSVEAMCKLAEYHGSIGEKEQSVDMWRKAADAGSAEAVYVLAKEGLLGQDNNEQMAVDWLESEADKGSVEAMCKLALCYNTGFGVKQNIGRAVDLWEKAAEEESNEAGCRLAECYYRGEGVDKSIRRALELWEAAADKTFADAHCRLAEYYTENAVSSSSEKSLAHWYQAAKIGNATAAFNVAELISSKEGKRLWYKKAADLGNADAMCKLAFYSVRDEKFDSAERLYIKAAEIGSKEALKELLKIALAYASKKASARIGYYRGIKPDLEKGELLISNLLKLDKSTEILLTIGEATENYKWYEVAAEAGSIEAMLQFDNSDRYSEFGVIKCTPEQSLKWLSKAAEAGNKEALEKLRKTGRKYLDDRWLDGKNAVLFLEKAAELGHIGAMEDLGTLCMFAGVIDEDIALSWLVQAHSAGDDRAAREIYSIGANFTYGYLKIKVNFDLAAKWWLKAAELGDERAKEDLPKYLSSYSEEYQKKIKSTL